MKTNSEFRQSGQLSNDVKHHVNERKNRFGQLRIPNHHLVSNVSSRNSLR